LSLSHPDHDTQEQEAEVEKSGVQFGMTLGATGENEDSEEHGFGTRSVGVGWRVSTILFALHPSFCFLMSVESADEAYLTLRSSTRQTKCARSAL
jgi:hypothetical protein